MSAADLIVKPCHPIGRAGPTAVRNAVLVLETTHLVFRGGIGGTLRASLSLGLGARKFVCEYFSSVSGDRKGEPASLQADREPWLRRHCVFTSGGNLFPQDKAVSERKGKDVHVQARGGKGMDWTMWGCGRDQLTKTKREPRRGEAALRENLGMRSAKMHPQATILSPLPVHS